MDGPASDDEPVASAASLRVLMVDDDADQRLLLGLLFAQAGISPVLEASNADEAVAAALTHQPDLIVLDLAMPGRSGLDVLPELREQAPGASVVVLSNFPRHRMVDAVKERGALGYVEKGTRPDRLVAEILFAAAISAAALGHVTADLPADISSPRAARRLLHDVLGPEDETMLSTGELLISELVSNAVLHASSAPRVEVYLSRRTMRVAVRDDDPTLPEMRTPDLDRPGGRGLHILDQLASRWGAEARDGGKVVWFEVDRPTPL